MLLSGPLVTCLAERLFLGLLEWGPWDRFIPLILFYYWSPLRKAVFDYGSAPIGGLPVPSA